MTEEFNNLKMPSLKFTKLNQRYYRVYKNKSEFIQVEEATSVNEAIDKAGIEHPYAVKLVIYYLGSIVKEELLIPASLEENPSTEENTPAEANADNNTSEDNPNTETTAATENKESPD